MSSQDAKRIEDKAISLLAEFVEVSKSQQLRAHYDIVGGEPGSWLGPYPWQVKFHNAGKEFPERAIIAANQCVSPKQLIPTDQGTRYAHEIRAGDVLLSYDDTAGETIPAVVNEVFHKPHEYLVRVEFSNGETLEAAAAHHLLTTAGWKSVASCIRHRADALGLRQARVEDDVRWLQTASSLPIGCPVCHHCGGELLRWGEGDVPNDAPSQAYVQEHMACASVLSGDLESRQERSRPCRSSDHLSISDDPDRFLARCAESTGSNPYTFYRPCLCLPSVVQRSSIAAGVRLRRACAREFHQVRYDAFLVSPHDGFVSIVDFEITKPQMLIDFNVPPYHNYEAAGVIHRNTGKTRTAAAEVAIHLTGLYPPWWQGHRFTGATAWIAAGNTNEDVRNIQQKALVGAMSEASREPSGEGWIPSDCIGTCGFRQCGIPNVLDTVKVKHVSGEWSTLMFKSYEQGAVKFQGLELNGAWLDEEPPLHHDDIFSEARTRLITRNGLLLFSRTPLFGMSRIIRHFLEGGPGIWWIGATWEEAPHLAKAARERYSLTYMEHEVDARTKGVPMLGSGGVYPVPDEQITCQAFEIPKHFRQICGVDFGIDHPAAGCWIAYDADADIIYVVDCYKMRGETASYHSTAIKSRGQWIPVAWPHDGMIRDKGGGVALKDQYIACGVNMLGDSARYDDKKGGGQSREPQTMDILDRMRTGRLKIFKHLEELLAEKRLLHRKDGQIVARDDDIESAMRYACMMIRYAVSDAEWGTSRYRKAEGIDMDYDPLTQYSYPGIT